MNDPGNAVLLPPAIQPRPSAQTVALVTLAVLAVFCTLSVAAEIVVPLLLAIVLKLMLQPAMRFLSDRLGLPVGLAAFLLIVALFGVVAALFLSIAVPASGWINKAPQGLATLQEQLRVLRGPLAAVQYYVQQMERMVDSGSPASGVAAAGGASGALGQVGLSILMGTQVFFGRLVVLVVTLFFMLAAGDSMLRRLVEVVPRLQEKKHVVYITNEIERNVASYLGTITAVNLAVGVIAGVAMYLCGVADPLLWGTVAFLLNFVPIVGPLIGIALFFVVGLLSFGHALPALLPAAIYLTVHIVEGQMVTPLLLARRFTLSPVIVIISLFFWYWMWGIPGALLSVPLLATFKIICDRIPSLAALGHMLGG
jgi:predicted PurR-regulated permease PerM